MDYRPNLMHIKPDYVVHGDDWKKGFEKAESSDFNLKNGWKINRAKYTKQFLQRL